MQKYNKAIVAALGGIIAFLANNCGGTDVQAFIALATTLGVYAAPNKQ